MRRAPNTLGRRGAVTRRPRNRRPRPGDEIAWDSRLLTRHSAFSPGAAQRLAAKLRPPVPSYHALRSEDHRSRCSALREGAVSQLRVDDSPPENRPVHKQAHHDDNRAVEDHLEVAPGPRGQPIQAGLIPFVPILHYTPLTLIRNKSEPTRPRAERPGFVGFSPGCLQARRSGAPFVPQVVRALRAG